jgi:16S rRNA (cytosine1407-C5)-methyltransferase
MSRKLNKTPQKKAAWISRTAEALTISQTEAAALLRTRHMQSVRINTLRGSRTNTLDRLKKSGWSGAPYDWMPDGYSIESSLTEIRDSPLISEGMIYIQNAASWLPVIALEPRANEDILDVCAAPGGKTSHIAAVTNNRARIWANDNSRPRLAKLRANMDRLGAKAERYTLYDAAMLARKLAGQQFDKILLDAPCSGEGLMNLDNDADFASWSIAHIKRLEKLQKRILLQSWQLLKPGGTLVYSTCTMAPEENEAVIDYLLRKREDAQTQPFEVKMPNRVPAVSAWNGKSFNPETNKVMRLVPSDYIEAFFVAKLKKVAQPR